MQILCDVKDWLLKYSIRVKILKQRLLTMIMACVENKWKAANRTYLSSQIQLKYDSLHYYRYSEKILVIC